MFQLSNWRLFYVVFSFSLVHCFSCVCYGQLNNAIDGVVRVETAGGTGSGFVVASRDSKFEVWTNGHVVGRPGSSATIRVRAGTDKEASFVGVVARRRYEGGHDWAKIVASGDYVGRVFEIGSKDSSLRHAHTGGFPRGRRFYSLVVDLDSTVSLVDVQAYRPASIPGQSGSPVVDENGMVVGVVTLRIGRGASALGGFLPIDDWTGTDRVSIRDVGRFVTLENAPPVN